ncbi:DUF1697 domain-containing protein [Geodermatophilus sp. CPCC 206100]|uniref:DUF1697 domain-containing protein n=1 Tax=Geodermatophilus sp. CPCC 206100 TaxID=3020054 RepID=UPI003AFFF93C
MTRSVVLLRGINLGRARQVGMAELREALTARGHEGVRTHLRSGNVVLDSPLDEAALTRDVEEAVRARFGFDVPVVVRTGAELAAVVAADPLGAVATDPARYLVTFLPREPDPERVAALPAADAGEYRVLGRELFLWLPDGVTTTPVGAWDWDRLLGVPGTARNWNTVRKVAALAAV